MASSGWLKLHYSLLDWEWYDDTAMVRLYLHLLLRANYKDVRWHGMMIGRGQLVTSIASLSKETGLSAQKVRTCLKRLKSTHEITQTSTNKLTILTLCKYEDYQSSEESTNKQTTSRQHATDTLLTTSKESKKDIKKECKKITLSNEREGEECVVQDAVAVAFAPSSPSLVVESFLRRRRERVHTLLRREWVQATLRREWVQATLRREWMHTLPRRVMHRK